MRGEREKGVKDQGSCSDFWLLKKLIFVLSVFFFFFFASSLSQIFAINLNTFSSLTGLGLVYFSNMPYMQDPPSATRWRPKHL